MKRSIAVHLMALLLALACEAPPGEPESGSTSGWTETPNDVRKISLSPDNAHFATARTDASGNTVTRCVKGLALASSTVSSSGASPSALPE